MRRLAFVIASCSLVLWGCPKEHPTAGPDAAASANDGGAPDAKAATDGGGDEVESVYPDDPKAPPDPLAEKLCAAVGELQEKKRAACCKATPGIVPTSECVRMLSAAIRFKAVEVSSGAVDGCVAALDESLEGCDWVGPFAPVLPDACHGLVKGTLAEGKRCRSSLECVAGLRCHGSGPTTPGTCAPPKNDGELCGGVVDSLATYTRQTDDLDKVHPECKDRCIKHKCAPPATEGKPCQTTRDCDTGLSCLLVPNAPPPKMGAPPRTCVAGKPPGKEGEACPGGECAEGLSCIKNKCASRKPTGATCTTDFECKGGCLKDGGTTGTCGPRCDIR